MDIIKTSPARNTITARQFVKYAPEVNTLSPRFAEDLDTFIAGVEMYINNSVKTEGAGRAVRFAHAKGYGLVKSEVEILDGLPREYAQGIYATAGKHDALIRFSNGSAHLGVDAALGNVTGLALKIFGIPGPTMLDDEPDTGTFDYVNINMPVFFCNTVAHYLFIQQLIMNSESYFVRGRSGAHKFFADYLTGKGTLARKDWAWGELLAFLPLAETATGERSPVNVLDDGCSPTRRIHCEGSLRACVQIR